MWAKTATPPVWSGCVRPRPPCQIWSAIQIPRNQTAGISRRKKKNPRKIAVSTGAHRDLPRVLLLPPRDPGGLVPRDLDRAPDLAGRPRPHAPRPNRRRRGFRPHRRLRVRPRDCVPRRQAASAETALLTFEQHVRNALDSLPPDLRAGLENVA